MIHTIDLPGFVPVSVNRLMNGHWAKRKRLKDSDASFVAYSCLAAQIPPAEGKRRVSCFIQVSGRRRSPDPDNVLKSLLDALVRCRMLIDDSAKYIELGSIQVVRGEKTTTTVTLEDIEDEKVRF